MVQRLCEEIDQLSTVTSMEYVELKSTLAATHLAEYRCGYCTKKYEKTPAQFDHKGCKKPQNLVVSRIGNDLRFKRCPGNFFSYTALHWIKNHELFENGVLPFPGSLSDQPAKAIDTFEIIGEYFNQRKIEENKAHQHQLKGMQRGR